MNLRIDEMIDAFAAGNVSRRELIAGVSGLVAAAAMGRGAPVHAEDAPTFRAVGLNHMALRVTDVPRARDFYMKHLGTTIAREALPGNCFLNFDGGFLALFRGGEPRMDHYCYSVENYDVNVAAEKLRAHGIQPRVEGQRIYFPDADGLTVQLAASEHRA
jgi:catechol 2,3-dioxygenase-like lactoylglutathione lyase family enzyme